MEPNCRCGHTRAQHRHNGLCKECSCWGYESSLVLAPKPRVTATIRLPHFADVFPKGIPAWYGVDILHGNIEQGTKEVTKSARSRKETALARVKELEKELAFLARFPDDDFPEHTVLMTWKTYTKDVPHVIGDPNVRHWQVEKQEFTYTYVLLKANGQWWATGTNGHGINGASWDKVIEFVDEDDVIDVRTGKSIMLDAETADELTSHPVAQVSLERPTRDES